MELNKTYCGDNCKLIKELDDECINLTVTSPPYGEIRDYDGFEWNFEKLTKELYRVTKDGGIVVWVVNDETKEGSETGDSFRQALHFIGIGFKLHDTMIYQKTGCCMPAPNRYLSNFEYMFVFSKGKPKTFNGILDRINKFPERWGGGGKVRNKDGTWSHRRKRDNAKRYGLRFNIWQYNNGGQGYGHSDNHGDDHPAKFPEKLAEDHIISWSNEGDLILDPFMGSGTTAKMALKNQRNFIGFEISQKYVDIANKRIQGWKNQSRMDQWVPKPI